MDEGWYTDPIDSGRQRYWTGSQWSQHVTAPDGTVVEDDIRSGVTSGPPRGTDGPPSESGRSFGVNPITFLAAGALLLIAALLFVLLGGFSNPSLDAEDIANTLDDLVRDRDGEYRDCPFDVDPASLADRLLRGAGVVLDEDLDERFGLDTADVQDDEGVYAYCWFETRSGASLNVRIAEYTGAGTVDELRDLLATSNPERAIEREWELQEPPDIRSDGIFTAECEVETEGRGRAYLWCYSGGYVLDTGDPHSRNPVASVNVSFRGDLHVDPDWLADTVGRRESAAFGFGGGRSMVKRVIDGL